MQAHTEKFAGEGLTFDDVLLLPAYSEVLPREVDISSRLTRSISLKKPIVSAAMDTVTEYRLAITLAQEGGIGFIHKNMTIEQQAHEVRKVKRSESGLIIDPITLSKHSIIGHALQIMKDNKIGGIPVVDDQFHLVGILTNRDLRFEQNMNKPVSELMTNEGLITAPEGTDFKEAESILKKHRIEKLPVVNPDGKLAGLITYKDILKIQNYPDACKDQYGRLRVGAAIGITEDMLERIQALTDVDVDVVCIDTAHGHSKGVLSAVQQVKETFSDLQVIAGNVGTEEGARAMVDTGVDGVKVGVGPGSICTTRVVAGVGIPQLTAIYEASKGVANTDVPLIADGGIRYTGDIAKAIVAGADSIMAGSLFAGVEESPGETIIYEGRKFKSYRGMGSIEAMQQGSKDRYFQDVEEDIQNLVPEGIVGRIPYKGTLAEVIVQYVGGLKAGMGYCGASAIQELKKARFMKVTVAGVSENHPHDIFITKEAPNYSR